MISLRVAIMDIAVMLGLANVMKGSTVTVAQVNFLSFFHKLVQKIWQQSNIFVVSFISKKKYWYPLTELELFTNC